MLRLIEGIEAHFDYISEMLAKKKLQIIQYYDQEFQNYLQEHRNYDQEMKERVEWLQHYTQLEDIAKINTI